MFFNLYVSAILKSLGKYLQNNPVQISHFAGEEIEELSTFLKFTQAVRSGRLGLEAKFSHSAFFSHYTIWLHEAPLLQVLLGIYTHIEKPEHIWVILVIFKSFEMIGESFNIAKAHIRKKMRSERNGTHSKNQ